MAERLAILAGRGALPGLLARAAPEALFVTFDGVGAEPPKGHAHHLRAAFSQIGALFDGLRAQGVDQVVLAGAMARPTLDPDQFDDRMQALAPRLMAAMTGGDDALLRLVIKVFEEEGFAVLGAHQVAPDLVASEGVLTRAEPTGADFADIERATAILAALAPLDIGQATVVAGGLCLGIETLQGTDALLRFVAATPADLRRQPGGVLVKRPKAGQELRVDMPAIGPDTVKAAAAAGLGGIVVTAGQVMLLERDALLATADEAELFLWAIAP